ncbi:MAG: carboxypeptidase-like regulatory domain-containing protein [Kofleriaceae bacterium]
MKIRTLAVAGLVVAVTVTARHAWSHSDDDEARAVAPAAPTRSAAAIPKLVRTAVAIEPVTRDEPQLPSADLGTLRGQLLDDDGEPLVTAVVELERPGFERRVVTTDAEGNYELADVPVGSYQVVMSGSGRWASHTVDIDGGQITDLDDSPPPQRGITLEPTYIRNIPVPGRVFESVLGSAADSQGDDGLGVSFSGVSTLENVYIVDEEGTADE